MLHHASLYEAQGNLHEHGQTRSTITLFCLYSRVSDASRIRYASKQGSIVKLQQGTEHRAATGHRATGCNRALGTELQAATGHE